LGGAMPAASAAAAAFSACGVGACAIRTKPAALA
jgi:hypothetical protein